MPPPYGIDDIPPPIVEEPFVDDWPDGSALSADPRQALRDLFGFDGFRPLQEEAVRATLDKRDVLLVMPTGAGKSLCFQLPALMSQAGVTLVVSPLIALMHDQVDALARRSPAIGALCGCLSSLQGGDAQRDTLNRLRAGRLRLLYVAPERFRSGTFLEALRRAKVARFVVDEAHCISAWGHDFRPDYLSLLPVLDMVGRPPVLAATATATRGVQASIAANLGLRDPAVLVGGFNRPNLHWSVHRCASENARNEKLALALPKLAAAGGSGLIYVPTRKACEEIGESARSVLAPLSIRAGIYHAGMDAADRNAAQAGWLAGDLHVLAATSAFGMGIDKPDVRYVIHAGYPDSLESYYQEAGRAGRDGGRSRCVILTTPGDWRTRDWFLNNETLEAADVRKLYQLLQKSATAGEVVAGKAELTFSLGSSLVKLRLALAELDRAEMICRLAETADDVALTLGPKPWDEAVMTRIARDLGRQQKEKRRRLDEMVDYCRTTTCRRRAILSYFADRIEAIQTANCCDNCDRPAQAKPAASAVRLPAVPMPAAIARGDIHALLQALDALRPALGRTRLDKLLRGSGTETDALKRTPLYGAFKGAGNKQVVGFLEGLVKAGLMRQGGEDEYFVLTVTPAGRAAWQEHTAIPADVPAIFRPAPARAAVQIAAGNGPGGSPLSIDDPELFEALRQWRAKEASKKAMPPYCILSDKALKEISALCPMDVEDLMMVNGIGKKKLDQYGQAILNVIDKHLQH